jgi:hypothetical protein
MLVLPLWPKDSAFVSWSEPHGAVSGFPTLPLRPRFVSMTIDEILIWEATNALLLILLVIGVVMLMRWIRGCSVFTERDWLFLFGHPREKVFSLHL